MNPIPKLVHLLNNTTGLRVTHFDKGSKFMITKLESPERMFAMRVDGKISKEAIKSIDQILEKYMDQYGELLLYIEIVNFSYKNAEAFWEDLKADFKYLGDCKKIALATDDEWMAKMSNFLSKITPIEIKIFHLNVRGKAFAWLS